jgi:hypothetical protein
MGFEASVYAQENTTLRGDDYLLLLFLAMAVDDETGAAFRTTETLLRETHMDMVEFRAALDRLTSSGIVRLARRLRNSGEYTYDVYILQGYLELTQRSLAGALREMTAQIIEQSPLVEMA